LLCLDKGLLEEIGVWQAISIFNLNHSTSQYSLSALPNRMANV
jgi:hypothetical protein